MNPDIEKELFEIKEIVKENNKILRKLERERRFNLILSFVKWGVYIAILIGTYSILRPFIDQMLNTYGLIQESAGTISDLKNQTQGIDINSLKELLK